MRQPSSEGRQPGASASSDRHAEPSATSADRSADWSAHTPADTSADRSAEPPTPSSSSGEQPPGLPLAPGGTPQESSLSALCALETHSVPLHGQLAVGPVGAGAGAGVGAGAGGRRGRLGLGCGWRRRALLAEDQGCAGRVRGPAAGARLPGGPAPHARLDAAVHGAEAKVQAGAPAERHSVISAHAVAVGSLVM